jgi:hypothetical protein
MGFVMRKPDFAMLGVVDVQSVEKFPHFFDTRRIEAISPTIGDIICRIGHEN